MSEPILDSGCTSGYSAASASRLSGLSARDLSGLVAAGLVQPDSSSGQQRFSFQDLVLMRMSGRLRKAGISRRRIQRALSQLGNQGHAVSAVRLWADGRRIVAQQGASRWQPESGQQLFNFEEAASADASRMRKRSREEAAVGWFERGCELEATHPEAAVDAYRRALEHEPDHLDAHLNLGRLLHEQSRLHEAEDHYRAALARQPDEALCHYNLGVVLEDQLRESEAIEAYQKALECDARLGDAHFNLARVYERKGQRGPALRHLFSYRRLSH